MQKARVAREASERQQIPIVVVEAAPANVPGAHRQGEDAEQAGAREQLGRGDRPAPQPHAAGAARDRRCSLGADGERGHRSQPEAGAPAREPGDQLGPLACHARARHNQVEARPLGPLARGRVDVAVEAERPRLREHSVARERFDDRRPLQVGVDEVHDEHAHRRPLLREPLSQARLVANQLDLVAGRGKAALDA